MHVKWKIFNCYVEKLQYSNNFYSFSTTFVKFIWIFENGSLVSLFWEWPIYEHNMFQLLYANASITSVLFKNHFRKESESDWHMSGASSKVSNKWFQGDTSRYSIKF